MFSGCVGGQGDKHPSIGDGRENGDMAAGKSLLPLDPQRIPWKKFRVDHRDQDLLLPNLSWDEKVVFTLDMVRRRGLFEYNPKTYSTLPTRFCQFNIAFFDLDKECEYILSMSYSLHLLVSFLSCYNAYPSTSCIRVYLAICLAFSCPYFTADFKREPWSSKIPNSYWDLDASMNIISIKVSESDVPYPINIYGTVVARDQVDYRCVYLFKCSRDNPQLITSMVGIYLISSSY